MAQIDFARLRDLVHEFEQVLSDHGLRIVESSSLEHICLFLQDLEGRRSRRDPVDLHRDIRPDWRMAVGLADLLLRILRVARTGGLPPFLRHLRLLNTSMPAQNVRAVCDQGSISTEKIVRCRRRHHQQRTHNDQYNSDPRIHGFISKKYD